MSKTLAYLRTSTDKQDLNNQKLEILEFVNRIQGRVDEFIEITISSRKTTKQRRIDELLAKLDVSDTLIVTELSRLGRSTAEVIALVNQLAQQHIRVEADCLQWCEGDVLHQVCSTNVLLVPGTG